MHLPIVSVRYGLMLEAYCRGCGKYRDSLAEQVYCVCMHSCVCVYLIRLKL